MQFAPPPADDLSVSSSQLLLCGIFILLLAGCGRQTQLILVNEGGLSVVVQPDRPQAHPGCLGNVECDDFHRAVLLDAENDFAEDVYAEPGSVVRVFNEDCEQLDTFTFTQGGGLGQTAFQIGASGQVSTVTQYNVMGDPAAGSVEHSPCPVP